MQCMYHQLGPTSSPTNNISLWDLLEIKHDELFSKAFVKIFELTQGEKVVAKKVMVLV